MRFAFRPRTLLQAGISCFKGISTVTAEIVQHVVYVVSVTATACVALARVGRSA